MYSIVFSVEGEPVAKARPRMTRTGHVYTPKKTADAEERIRNAFLKKIKKADIPKDAKVELMIDFFFTPPKSAGLKKCEEMYFTGRDKKPDIDNLCKTVMDALNGIAFKDDSQIVKLRANKVYGRVSGTTVEVIYQ